MISAAASAKTFEERWNEAVPPVAPACPLNTAPVPIQQKVSGDIRRIAEKLETLAPDPAPIAQPSYAPAGTPVCPGYLNADGSPGAKGRVFATQLDKPFYSATLLSDRVARSNGMGLVCPNFASLSREERKQFWLYVFASINEAESTCGTNPKTLKPAQDVHGIVIGDFQMNYPYGDRFWRGAPQSDKACAIRSAKAMGEFGNNARCALDIITDQMRGVHDPRNPGLLGNSYFALLNTRLDPSRKNSKVVRNIQRFAPCGAVIQDAAAQRRIARRTR